MLLYYILLSLAPSLVDAFLVITPEVKKLESKLLLLLSNDPTGKAIGGWGMQYG